MDDRTPEPTAIGSVIAEQTLRGLRRRLFFGRVHGDVVAEVTGRRRPDDGIVVIGSLALASVAVAFLIGFASVVVGSMQQNAPHPGTTTTPDARG